MNETPAADHCLWGLAASEGCLLERAKRTSRHPEPLSLLKWSAQQEAIAKEAGAPPTIWFRHLDGASWDYIAIARVGTGAQEEELGKKSDAIAKAKGLATGAAAQLEFRALISTHTDTYAMGPMAAEELVKE